MILQDILRRIDLRLAALGLSDSAAQKAAGTPGAISNMRSALKKGGRTGISTSTLLALAPVLKARPEWILTGLGPMNLEDLAEQFDTLSSAEAEELMAWMFQTLEGASEPESRIAAQAVVRAYRTPLSDNGREIGREDRRRLVALAIRLVRRPKP